LQTTAPNELVIDLPRQVAAREPVPGADGFTPMRTDPPPRLVPTWWLRLLLLIGMLDAILLTLWTEYAGQPNDVSSSVVVIAANALVIAALLTWSFIAMRNARVLVPATRYRKTSRGWLADLLWLQAFAGPAGAGVAYRALRDRLAEPDDMGAVFIFAGVVLMAFVMVWLPFRYHARQAKRIGAPHSTMIAWFWLPLSAVVGSLLIVSTGLRDLLAEDGHTDIERMTQVGVVFGLPMLVFALATWRAVTVFDEVLDLRWRRWKHEWEQTLEDFVAQPTPGPEGAPNLTSHSR
jgi:hypothetical protein